MMVHHHHSEEHHLATQLVPRPQHVSAHVTGSRGGIIATRTQCTRAASFTPIGMESPAMHVQIG
jgi:hypothetical protein